MARPFGSIPILLTIALLGGCVERTSPVEDDGATGGNGAAADGSGGRADGDVPTDDEPGQTGGTAGSAAGGVTQEAEREALDAEVEAVRAVVDLSCMGDESCGVLPLGAKGCGGPHEWLVYSSDQLDPESLRQTVCEFNAAEERYNAKWGVGSDCSTPNVTAVACVSGECAFTDVPVTGLPDYCADY